jgi:ABC-type antimicrobial peptide transport system permease subunit
MEDLVAASETRRTFALTIFSMFALTALLLASVGVYGVMEGSVTERTREIGVRSAVGAAPRKLALLIVRDGMGLAGLGALVGIAAAAGATRALESLLFGVERFDPLICASAVAALLSVSLLACYAPAWRAARIDPSITLRAQ